MDNLVGALAIFTIGAAIVIAVLLFLRHERDPKNFEATKAVAKGDFSTGLGHVGERVLYGMQKTSINTWSGSAHNPEDGGTYAGTMTLNGNRLVTRGCAVGGLLCQTVSLTRAR